MTPRATVDLPLPQADAAALHAFAARLRDVGRALGQTQSTVSGQRDGLTGSWSGPAAAHASTTLTGLAAVGGEAAQAMATAAAAVGTHAAAVEAAHREVLALQRQRADADAELEHGLRVAARTETDPLARWQAESSLHDRHAMTLWSLGRAHGAVLQTLDRAGLTLRRALEDTRGPLVRGHRESLEDYVHGIAAALVGRLPVLQADPDTVAAMVWATATTPGLWYAQSRVRRTWSLLSEYRSALAAWAGPGALPLNPRYRGMALSALSRIGAVDRYLSADNVITGAAAARSQNLLTVYRGSAGVASFGRQVGWVRGAGVVGSAGATVVSAVNVASQGNPVRAFQENGADYVADVSETLFHGSVTAMLVAPNPVTAGAVVVTGVVYVGTEIYAHREEIGRLASSAAGAASDLARGAADAADDALDAVASGVGDGARAVGSALNPFD